MVKENNPNILFLIETKCNKNKLENLRVKLRYGGLFIVDSVGRSGGLALFWREDVLLEIQNFHINAIVKCEDSGIGSLQVFMDIQIGKKGMNLGPVETP